MKKSAKKKIRMVQNGPRNVLTKGGTAGRRRGRREPVPLMIPPSLYPPPLTSRDFRYVPARHRPDAIQEAWVAFLELRDARAAVARFVQRARRHEARQVPGSQLRSDARLAGGSGAQRLGWLSPVKGQRGQVELAGLGSEAHRYVEEE